MAFVEEFAPFFADFGTDAVVGSETVRGHFDNAYGESLSVVCGSVPSFLCASSDVDSSAVGTPVTINAVAYTVVEIRPDGTGMTRLMLEAT